MKSLSLLSASMGCELGGTETYVRTLAHSLQSKIETVGLVTGGNQVHYNSDYSDLVSGGTFKTCSFPMLGRHSQPAKFLVKSWLGQKIYPTDLESLSALLFAPKISGFLQKYDILEAHYPLDGLLFPFLPKRLTKILHFHGAWPPPLFRKSWKYVKKHTDGVVACSLFARDELQKIMPDMDIDIVHNGVDITTFTPGDNDYCPSCNYNPKTLKVGTVARLSRDKGTDLLCRIARELNGEVEFFLAGPADSGFESELEQMATIPNVHLLGPISYQNMPGFYRFLDCFVLPSRFEAFPLTILEAMSSGCAVVATNVGGIPEMIGNKATAGLLFPPGDKEALISHLRNLRANLNYCSYLGQHGRSRIVDHFSLEKSTAQALAVYNKYCSVDSEMIK